MLNYVFGGMVVLSLVFALWQDGADLSRNTWRNGEIVPLEIILRDGSDIRFRIDGD